MNAAVLPLAYLALAWLLGVAAAAYSGGEPAASVAAGGLLGVVSFAAHPRLGTLALIAAGCFLIAASGVHYQSSTPDLPSIAKYNGKDNQLFRAIVVAEPDERATSTLYELSVTEVRRHGRWLPESGRLLMRSRLFPAHQFGDLLEIRGLLEAPPELEDFDYSRFLLRRGIASVVSFPDVDLVRANSAGPVASALSNFRRSLSQNLADTVPEPQASLATGILLGGNSRLPEQLREDMQRTGTAHLVAVSGQNVILLAGLVIAVCSRVVGRRPAAWLALASIFAFAALVGGQPSVVRAAVMGGLYVASVAIGRQNTGFITLGIAASLMTAADPQIVRDVSFQLSVGATVGLVLMTPQLNSYADRALSASPYLYHLPIARSLTDVATMTISATLFTFPIILMNFDRVSIIGPLANLLVVPAFIAVALSAAVSAPAAAVLPDIPLIGWFAWAPPAYMIKVIEILAALPLASLQISWFDVPHAVAWYALVLGGLRLMRSPLPRIDVPMVADRPSKSFLPAVAMASVLACALILLWLVASPPAPARLSVTFLDVGQGDAILIETPGGQRILVDGGPSRERISLALGRHLTPADHRIDLIVLTHPQADHVAGLTTVIDRFDVGGLLTGAASPETATFDAWRESLSDTSFPIFEARKGQIIDLDGGARLTVLSAPTLGGRPSSADVNDASLVLRLSMGNRAFLLAGDISEQAEAELMASTFDIESETLKIAHHGSRTSTSARFLQRVAPSIDVISVGDPNPYGHPSTAVLDRLREDLVLRTDLHGDITVETDGRRLWVRAQRKFERGGE